MIITKETDYALRILRVLLDGEKHSVAETLTVTEPIHYQLIRKDVGLTVYKCSGTPADCVKLAFHTVLDRKPDQIGRAHV